MKYFDKFNNNSDDKVKSDPKDILENKPENKSDGQSDDNPENVLDDKPENVLDDTGDVSIIDFMGNNELMGKIDIATKTSVWDDSSPVMVPYSLSPSYRDMHHISNNIDGSTINNEVNIDVMIKKHYHNRAYQFLGKCFNLETRDRRCAEHAIELIEKYSLLGFGNFFHGLITFPDLLERFLLVQKEGKDEKATAIRYDDLASFIAQCIEYPASTLSVSDDSLKLENQDAPIKLSDSMEMNSAMKSNDSTEPKNLYESSDAMKSNDSTEPKNLCESSDAMKSNDSTEPKNLCELSDTMKLENMQASNSPMTLNESMKSENVNESMKLENINESMKSENVNESMKLENINESSGPMKLENVNESSGPMKLENVNESSGPMKLDDQIGRETASDADDQTEVDVEIGNPKKLIAMESLKHILKYMKEIEKDSLEIKLLPHKYSINIELYKMAFDHGIRDSYYEAKESGNKLEYQHEDVINKQRSGGNVDCRDAYHCLLYGDKRHHQALILRWDLWGEDETTAAAREFFNLDSKCPIDIVKNYINTKL